MHVGKLFFAVLIAVVLGNIVYSQVKKAVPSL